MGSRHEAGRVAGFLPAKGGITIVDCTNPTALHRVALHWLRGPCGSDDTGQVSPNHQG
jgi:hypothetical protein